MRAWPTTGALADLNELVPWPAKLFHTKHALLLRLAAPEVGHQQLCKERVCQALRVFPERTLAWLLQ